MSVALSSPLRRLCFRFLGLAVIATVGVGLCLGVSTDFAGFTRPFVVSVLLLVAAVGARWRGMQALADSGQTIALTIIFGLLAGAMGVFAARSGMPLVDRELYQLDRLIGLSATEVVVAVSNWPTDAIIVMKNIYQSSFPLVFLSLLLLPLLGASYQAWRLCLLFGVTLFAADLISCFTPAYGSYSLIDPGQAAGMPRQAGRFFWDILSQVRSDADLVLSPASLSGIITFPSFHAVMALLVTQAWWAIRIVRWPMLAWNILIILSAVPMGGHYFTDLLAGGLVWWVSWEAVRFLQARKFPQPGLVALPAS